MFKETLVTFCRKNAGWPNKEKELYRLASKYDSYDFKRFDDFKKYGLLAIYLLNLQKDFIDQAFYIHDTQITTLQSNGRKAQEEILKKNGKNKHRD